MKNPGPLRLHFIKGELGGDRVMRGLENQGKNSYD
jgi:hypothetical protein